jgi:peptidoglycan hydrolase-like protein with peptidoglycan-binding domain
LPHVLLTLPNTFLCEFLNGRGPQLLYLSVPLTSRTKPLAWALWNSQSAGRQESIVSARNVFIFNLRDAEQAAYHLLFSVADSRGTQTVTKYGFVIPICFIAAAGCALFDNSEMSTEAPSVSTPVTEYAVSQPASEVEVAPTIEALPAAHPVSAGDIRRLQLRLRVLGFDPGPVDGIAGTKTKAAFLRLQGGCTKLEPLSENFPVAALESSSGRTDDKIPTRDETVKIQSQLRRAGFDPGPIDGIFGSKTKSVVAQLQAGCLMAKQLDLGNSLRTTANNEATGRQTAQGSSLPFEVQSASALAHNDTVKRAATRQTIRSQEEIRILQLRLRDAGFDPGPFDGVMGAKTRLALDQYEASQRGRKIKTSLTKTTIIGQY